jgi:hypothetical protein
VCVQCEVLCMMEYCYMWGKCVCNSDGMCVNVSNGSVCVSDGIALSVLLIVCALQCVCVCVCV